MDEIHLLSGKWTEALDLMRRKKANYWSLEEPSGAECDTMLDEEKEAIFGKNRKAYWEKSKAERYILEWTDKNPLRSDAGDTEEIGVAAQGEVMVDNE
jgi:hypothetical protein